MLCLEILSRNGSSEISSKTSTMILQSKRVSKLVVSESTTSVSKPSMATSPKIECRSAKTMDAEKRRPSKVTELECQITQLQKELKKKSDQLSSTESSRRRAQQEAEEAKKQLVAMTAKLHDSHAQMAELSAAEDGRIQELRKISQERDRAWQSELEAIENQHSVDSAALASATSEIRRLKLQLEMVLRSEAALAEKTQLDQLQLQASEKSLAEASFAVEKLNLRLVGSERAEAEAKSMLADTRKQLELAQSTIESLLTDGSKLMESFSIVATELKESRFRVRVLEESVRKLQEEQYAAHVHALVDLANAKALCLGSSDYEENQLMPALEDYWAMHQEEQIESTVRIQWAYEMMEKELADSKLREQELELKLSDAKLESALLKDNLLDRESELRKISDLNKKLLQKVEKERRDMELTQSIADVADLKIKLADNEAALGRVCEENEQLKLQLRRKESEKQKAYEEAISEMNSAKTAEKAALTELGFVAHEAEKSKEMAARVVGELEATKVEKSEMEMELRKLRLQAEQWKKAAETAILMLTDSEHKPGAGKPMSLRSADELDDESYRKKKSYVLRRIKGMWNKEKK